MKRTSHASGSRGRTAVTQKPTRKQTHGINKPTAAARPRKANEPSPSSTERSVTVDAISSSEPAGVLRAATTCSWPVGPAAATRREISQLARNGCPSTETTRSPFRNGGTDFRSRSRAAN